MTTMQDFWHQNIRPLKARVQEVYENGGEEALIMARTRLHEIVGPVCVEIYKSNIREPTLSPHAKENARYLIRNAFQQALCD